MTILAIDPGSSSSGFAAWNGAKILESGMLPNSEMLMHVFLSNADVLAIEQMGNYGNRVGREVFDTCVWSGRFYQQWLSANLPGRSEPVMVARSSIKTHLVGKATANDSDVRVALIRRLGAPGTKRNPGPTYGVASHAWQALALAVFTWDQIRCGMPLERVA